MAEDKVEAPATVLQPCAREGMGLEPFANVLAKSGLEVEMVMCLGDNYCPLIRHVASNTVLVVDTPDGDPIKDALTKKGWTPTHILNTHHHYDHVGGNLALKEWCPSVRILGPNNREAKYSNGSLQKEEIPGMDQPVVGGEKFELGPMKVEILEVGGHTDGHVAYFFPEVPMLMSGDCLFNMGCGRVFTGNYKQMQESLDKLKALPDDTVVFCAHEYTTPNCGFALEVEPGNAAVQERADVVKARREAGLATVPTLLGHEKATNPFMRWDSPEIQSISGLTSPLDVFTFVRKWKNDGRKPDIGVA